MADQVQTDVAIIGAGPVGLFAVFECGMAGLRCAVIDSQDLTGGQCTALYPEKPIYDIPALPVVAAADLIAQLEQQASAFDPVYYLGQQVTALDRTAAGWAVATSAGRTLHARAVIIAGGAGAFGPQKPPLESLADYEGRSVFYAVQAQEQFRDKTVVIAGGGDSAIDWALALTGIARKVSLVHRRDKFRAAAASIGRLHAMAATGRIDLIVPYQLSQLKGLNGQLSAVVVTDMKGEPRTLEADILLPLFGLATTLGPIADWGLDLERAQVKTEPTTSATSVPGLFAIGDIAAYPHKLKLILTGFAEAAQAAHAIQRYLNPETEFHFEYSTTSGRPGSGLPGLADKKTLSYTGVMKILLTALLMALTPVPALAEELISPKPYCATFKNMSRYTLIGSVRTAYGSTPTGEKMRHESNFRLAPGETTEACSTGPFYPGYKVELILKTLIPVFSCMTRLSGTINLKAEHDDASDSTKMSADCLP